MCVKCIKKIRETKTEQDAGRKCKVTFIEKNRQMVVRDCRDSRMRALEVLWELTGSVK